MQRSRPISAPTKPRVILVTPALASGNNGNWQTARRWARFLAPLADVQTSLQWDGSPGDLMIALHARRSAPSIEAFAGAGGSVVLVLTGTDLYRDIQTDDSAQRSLELACRLVVLQSEGVSELGARWQDRVEVIYQSAPSRRPIAPRVRSFDLLLVGHLRAEKDPLTALRALRCLDYPKYRLLHIGDAKDESLRAEFNRMACDDERVQLLGALPHARTRQRIGRGRLLLLPSVMEGGANVLIEAATSGTPVLASRISGSVGMLGTDYPGYFPVGDHGELARLIEKCRLDAGFYETLRAICMSRAELFAPAREAAAVRSLLRFAASRTD